EKTFMTLIEVEVEKLFKRLDESGKLEEIIQAQMYKYLGSYKANLVGHYNQSYRLRELVSGYLAEQIKESLVVDVKLKGDPDGLIGGTSWKKAEKTYCREL